MLTSTQFLHASRIKVAVSDTRPNATLTNKDKMLLACCFPAHTKGVYKILSSIKAFIDDMYLDQNNVIKKHFRYKKTI